LVVPIPDLPFYLC